MTVQLLETERRFRAMNASVEAVAVIAPGQREMAARALAEVEALFERSERALSRFRPESELCALNAAAGAPFHASPMLFAVVSAAVAAAARTGGLFDPTVFGALIAAGYDRSFELLPDDRAGVPSQPGHWFNWQDIRLDSETNTILVPRGCGLDLGGIGKGWSLDRAAECLNHFAGFAIDAGGDIVAGGCQADGSRWPVGVQDPLEPGKDLARLELSDCAVATSTVARRRWLRGGRVQHHLIDPRTGMPSQSGVLAATVLAKAALLLGPTAGLRLLDGETGVEGMLVLDGGYVQCSRGLGELRRVA